MIDWEREREREREREIILCIHGDIYNSCYKFHWFVNLRREGKFKGREGEREIIYCTCMDIFSCTNSTDLYISVFVVYHLLTWTLITNLTKYWDRMSNYFRGYYRSQDMQSCIWTITLDVWSLMFNRHIYT